MAVWILLMHMLDIYIVVLPALHVAGVRPNPSTSSVWSPSAARLAAVFLKRLGDSSLFPVRDPRLAKSIALKN